MKRATWGYLGLLCWASGMMFCLQWYSQKQITAFDPSFLLQAAASTASFDQTLYTALVSAGIQGASLVHFESSAPCYCNQLSRPHYDVLSQRLAAEGYHHQRVNIDDHPALAAIIPSVPALAVVDENHQLRYLGPYATGYGCFTGRTLVGRIESLGKAEHPVGTAVMADAQGCFCQV